MLLEFELDNLFDESQVENRIRFQTDSEQIIKDLEKSGVSLRMEPLVEQYFDVKTDIVEQALRYFADASPKEADSVKRNRLILVDAALQLELNDIKTNVDSSRPVELEPDLEQLQQKLVAEND